MRNPDDFWRSIAEMIAWVAVFNGVARPVLAILSGTLWGPHAFVGGAFIVTSIVFACEFFKDEIDAAL